ncbi:MAG: phosphoribosylaminoimidazolesuccinocarboxamide synthase [Actinomycetota bacterium]|nr:phosphoribosylaminoimidazolesuccinocarboxamide synthase [Actinomycetota bacterium]
MSREPAYQLNLPHVYSGKVRDIYEAGNDQYLMVTSDRISAFDVVMDQPVPDKGRVLMAMSTFWFEYLSGSMESHLISTDLSDFPQQAQVPEIEGRSMLVRKVEMLPIECIVRGYITGSAWKEYKKHGTMHGTELPENILESEKLPEPVFTPSTKAQDGLHDENISFTEAAEIVGDEVAEMAREKALELYTRGSEYALGRGIIIADTKFEMGFVEGTLVVADEILTPDSSRFWPLDEWTPGTTPPSFDKQPVRDFLDGLDWDKSPPPPELPSDVITASSQRYREGYELISNKNLDNWPG